MSDVIVAIHQPQYLPWLPYFDKVSRCDVLVHLDTVQFQRRGVQNRNSIKTAHGELSLTVPVKASRTTLIKDVEIADARWVPKHIAAIRHGYSRAPHVDWLDEELVPILTHSWTRLVDLNLATLSWGFSRFGIACRQVRASDLDVSGRKDDLIIAICRALGATVYLSGRGAGLYQDPAKFAAAGIELRYQEYRHPVYQQCHIGLGFIAGLSALDLLLNEGPGAAAVLAQGRC